MRREDISRANELALELARAEETHEELKVAKSAAKQIIVWVAGVRLSLGSDSRYLEAIYNHLLLTSEERVSALKSQINALGVTLD